MHNSSQRFAQTALAFLLAYLPAAVVAQQPPADTSPHKVEFVTVEKDVTLEVLDWGGQGSPLVFLAGLGDTAHVFDALAPKFTDKHHVYGITRRGFGASSKPLATVANYSADRLGDDDLAVIEALKISRPVLAGHSVAGGELSSIGTRHSEKVAGLIYLEAAYSYAFYDPKVGSVPLPEMPHDTPLAAVLLGVQKYSGMKGPILAVMAFPMACGPACDDPRYKASDALRGPQMASFEASFPSARVIRVPQATHYIFRSNEPVVVMEMDSFMDALKH